VAAGVNFIAASTASEPILPKNTFVSHGACAARRFCHETCERHGVELNEAREIRTQRVLERLSYRGAITTECEDA
jgi:hypothetical protein